MDYDDCNMCLLTGTKYTCALQAWEIIFFAFIILWMEILAYGSIFFLTTKKKYGLDFLLNPYGNHAEYISGIPIPGKN